jgi:hypothetical protein
MVLGFLNCIEGLMVNCIKIVGIHLRAITWQDRKPKTSKHSLLLLKNCISVYLNCRK